MQKTTGEVKKEGVGMTHRENEAEVLEGEKAPEKESKLLDSPEIIDVDDEWNELIEESINDERETVA